MVQFSKEYLIQKKKKYVNIYFKALYWKWVHRIAKRTLEYILLLQLCLSKNQYKLFLVYVKSFDKSWIYYNYKLWKIILKNILLF